MSILDTYKISYAQHYEDIVLEAFFLKVADGFYVDVGANHPEQHSVTKLFYDRGWHGINIEPSPRMHKELETQRPRDINLQIGVADKPSKLTLRLYHSKDGLEGLSTFSNQIKEDYTREANPHAADFTDIDVPVKTLKDIFKDHAPATIHFMKIDVEGLEYEVLDGNDWQKYRPQVLCIEANHIVKDWHELLRKHKYRSVFHDGLNEYFVAEEASQLAEEFDYVRAMLLGKPIIKADRAKILDNLSKGNERLRRQLADLERELALSQQELAQVVYQRNSLYNEIEKYTHIRTQAIQLIVNVRRAFLRRAEVLNQPGRLHHTVHLHKHVSSRDSKEKLAAVALKYDSKALRESRILSGQTRLFIYRVIKFTDRKLVQVGKRLRRRGKS